MREANGFLLIVVGLLLLYVVVTGRLGLLENFLRQLFGFEQAQQPAYSPGQGPTIRGPGPILPPNTDPWKVYQGLSQTGGAIPNVSNISQLMNAA